MGNIKTFESFNDPNQKKVEKVQLSSYLSKSDFFAMKSKKEKDLIKAMMGKEFDKFRKNEKGDYVIQTEDKEIKELVIPKKFIYEIFNKD